jgi:hypothetical protein
LEAGGVEDAAKLTDGAGLRDAGIGLPDLRLRGEGGHDLLGDGVRVVRKIDGVAVALAHLAAVEAREDAGIRRDKGLRLREEVAEEVVESPGDLPRDLQVRGLVLAHRNHVRAIDQDVRRLQHGVAQQAVGDRLVVEVEVVALLLEGGDALQPPERRNHGEEEMELRVLLHVRLPEDGTLRRVQPRGDVVRRHLVGELRDLRRTVGHRGERVPVHDAAEHLVLVLQAHPLAQRALQVAQVKDAGGLHAAEKTLPCHDARLPCVVREMVKSCTQTSCVMRHASRGAVHTDA